MIIYPAIDIRGGRCVRLTEGRFDAETVFADDPAEMALKWAACGAEFLHLVDLDGALAGEGKNIPVIKRILEAVNIPVQLGGGIRNMQAIEKLLENAKRFGFEQQMEFFLSDGAAGRTQ